MSSRRLADQLGGEADVALGVVSSAWASRGAASAPAERGGLEGAWGGSPGQHLHVLLLAEEKRLLHGVPPKRSASTRTHPPWSSSFTADRICARMFSAGARLDAHRDRGQLSHDLFGGRDQFLRQTTMGCNHEPDHVDTSLPFAAGSYSRAAPACNLWTPVAMRIFNLDWKIRRKPGGSQPASAGTRGVRWALPELLAPITPSRCPGGRPAPPAVRPGSGRQRRWPSQRSGASHPCSRARR